jgi:hypothetical protein
VGDVQRRDDVDGHPHVHQCHDVVELALLPYGDGITDVGRGEADDACHGDDAAADDPGGHQVDREGRLDRALVVGVRAGTG